jgi:hypothetical protein
MLDNELIAMVISTVIAQEEVAGIPGLPIKQAMQPTQQGANTQPTAYLHKIGDRRVGFPRKSDEWDAMKSVMVHTELQKYETTFQISTLATQNPKTPQQYTASDVLNLIAYILQSAATVAAFEGRGVGILRVTDVRNPYFLDDRQRFEASPNLDFTLTHSQVIVSTTPVLKSEEFRILSV